MPADVKDVIGEEGSYGFLLRELADQAAKARGETDNAKGTLADLLAILAGPETILWHRLKDYLTDPADVQAFNAVVKSFEKDRAKFLNKLILRYPGLFQPRDMT